MGNVFSFVVTLKNDARQCLPYEAVGCCKYPVLVNKSTTTGVEERGLWTTVRPNLNTTDIFTLIIKGPMLFKIHFY